jgi:hypothetical protein
MRRYSNVRASSSLALVCTGKTLDEDISVAGLLAGRGDLTRKSEHAT